MADVHAIPERLPPTSLSPELSNQPHLPDLWSLAIETNPALREAAAGLEAARGRLLQSSLYLNPDFTYSETGLGDSRHAAGILNLQIRQEIITAGKRRLDIASASRGTDVAYLALVNRKFDVLGRIRRAYFDYVALGHILDVNDEVVASLARDTETTRKLVEDVKSRPPVDLVRMRALLEDAEAARVLTEAAFAASWKQLAAEVGVPELAAPPERPPFFEALPDLDEVLVAERVQSANTELKQLAMQIEQARAQLARAEVAAVPNVTIGAGYRNNFTAGQPGAIVSAQVPLPFWDRKQGLVRESQARLVQTTAILRSAETRLSRDTANAYGRYLGFKEQEDRLTRKVLPLLEEGLKAVQDLYAGGDPKRSFADVLLAQQNLNSTKLRRADVRRNLLQAYADLQALMQLDVDEAPAAVPAPEEIPPPRR
ncbi:MAG: TolC family protein [Planctomycetota bacterium]|nr:TolC family protein [Planctomycetota bacterium]